MLCSTKKGYVLSCRMAGKGTSAVVYSVPEAAAAHNEGSGCSIQLEYFCCVVILAALAL